MTNFGHMNLQAKFLLVGASEAKARKAYTSLGLGREWGYAYMGLEFAAKGYERIAVLNSDHLTESEQIYLVEVLTKKLKPGGLGKLVKL